MKAALLVGDTTLLPRVLANVAMHFRDVDIYALGIDIKAQKRSDIPGLFSTYEITRLERPAVLQTVSMLPNLAYADVESVEINDDHVPWMHQFDLAQRLFSMVPRTYTHYIRSRFDNFICEPLRFEDDVIVPTRYHHDLELLQKVCSDQFAIVPAKFADTFFNFATYYSRCKEEVLHELRAGNYQNRLDLIPEYKLKEWVVKNAIPLNHRPIKAYPFSWLQRLRHDSENAYVRDLPPGTVI